MIDSLFLLLDIACMVVLMYWAASEKGTGGED